MERQTEDDPDVQGTVSVRNKLELTLTNVETRRSDGGEVGLFITLNTMVDKESIHRLLHLCDEEMTLEAHIEKTGDGDAQPGAGFGADLDDLV